MHNVHSPWDAPCMTTASVRRLQLGNELRHLRKQAGIERMEDAGEVIERSQAVMSRLEHGETGIRNRDLRDLVRHYSDRIVEQGGEPIDIDLYLELNKGAEQRGRWSGYRSSYPKSFRMAVDLEADVSVLHVYQIELVHGLLQTKGYMQALFGPATAERTVADDRLRSRLERQQVLSKPEPPEVTFVLSESAIRRSVGDATVMRAQLQHLIAVSKAPNVHLHVLPFRAVTTAQTTFPFVTFRVPSISPATPPLDFVFVETLNDGDYLDGYDEVAQYDVIWGGLLGASLNEGETRTYIHRVAEEFEE